MLLGQFILGRNDASDRTGSVGRHESPDRTSATGLRALARFGPHRRGAHLEPRQTGHQILEPWSLSLWALATLVIGCALIVFALQIG